jgi:hypothetical protein
VQTSEVVTRSKSSVDRARVKPLSSNDARFGALDLPVTPEVVTSRCSQTASDAGHPGPPSFPAAHSTDIDEQRSLARS